MRPALWLAFGVLAMLAACDDAAKNPRRLWLDAQQEGQTASLSAVEPAPY